MKINIYSIFYLIAVPIITIYFILNPNIIISLFDESISTIIMVLFVMTFMLILWVYGIYSLIVQLKNK